MNTPQVYAMLRIARAPAAAKFGACPSGGRAGARITKATHRYRFPSLNP